jgi:hypothetical protein
MGGITLMVGLLLWLAARNPVRNIAVVDALIVGLCILSVTPLLSLGRQTFGVFTRRISCGDDPLCGSQ